MTCLEPYGSGAAVESAIREAARRSTTIGRDTSRLVREAIFDRFLCRVFADESETFTLKGGTGMLARIPTARTTRDIDLGDHFRFVHRDTQPVLEGDGQPYTHGARVRFEPYLGTIKKEGVSILTSHLDEPALTAAVTGQSWNPDEQLWQ